MGADYSRLARPTLDTVRTCILTRSQRISMHRKVFKSLILNCSNHYSGTSIWKLFIYLFEKMRFKLLVKMTHKFYKTFQGASIPQKVKNQYIITPNTKTGRNGTGEAMYQWPGYGGCCGETAPMHKSQGCSGPSHPLESCTCKQHPVTTGHGVWGAGGGGRLITRSCLGKRSPLPPSYHNPHPPIFLFQTLPDLLSLNCLFRNF